MEKMSEFIKSNTLTELACKLMIDVSEKAEKKGVCGLQLWESEYNKFPSYRFEKEEYMKKMENKYVNTHQNCVSFLETIEGEK